MKVLKTSMMTVMLLLSACDGPQTTAARVEPEQKPALTAPVFIACEEPRPEICTQEYAPVCASRDTGIRCVKAPCPASEWITSSSACTACSDPKVYGYFPGSCMKQSPQK